MTDNWRETGGMAATVEDMRRRKENMERGGVNCIPLPFLRFRSEVPGMERQQYVVITASTKGGKSQLCDFLYVFTPLEYAFAHPDRCRVHIIYFTLEEAPDRIRQRYISHLLWRAHGIRVPPSDLRSTDWALPDDVFRMIGESPVAERLGFFDANVELVDGFSSAERVRDVCVAYAKSVGKVETRTERFGDIAEREVFGRYVPDDPDLYNIVVLDHVSNIDPGPRLLKQAIDEVSKMFVSTLRDRYGFTCVLVHQQAFDTEGLDAIKMRRMKPTLSGLADSKYSARDANLVLGIFSPDRFGLPKWPMNSERYYDVSRLRDSCRFVEVLANRDGRMGGVCPLLFDGAVCDFRELPPPGDPAMEAIYGEVAARRTLKQERRMAGL